MKSNYELGAEIFSEDKNPTSFAKKKVARKSVFLCKNNKHGLLKLDYNKYFCILVYFLEVKTTLGTAFRISQSL